MLTPHKESARIGRPEPGAYPDSTARPRYGGTIAAATLAIVTIAAFQPFWTQVFAISDDYPGLVQSAEPGVTGLASRFILRDGRPLFALVFDGLFAAVGTIDGLRWIRVVSALGIFVLGLILARVFRQVNEHAGDAALMAAAAIVLTPMIIWSSWATAFAEPWAAAMGAAGGATLLRPPVQRSGWRALRYAQAVALLLASFLTYQPGAQFFWCVILIHWLSVRPGVHLSPHRVWVTGLAVFCVSAVVYLIVWRVYVPLVVADLGWTERAVFAHASDLPLKLRWFVQEPLVNAANLFSFEQNPWTAALVCSIAVAGTFVILRTNGRPLLPSVAIAVGIVVLSHGVNIAIHDNWAAYRTLGALATCILILLVYGIRALLPTTVRAPLWRASVLAAIVAQVLNVRWNIAPYVVIAPQQQELRILRARVSAFVERESPAIVFKMPSWSENHAQVYRYDEIGAPSSSAPWVPDPAVRLIYRELTGRPFRGEIEVVDAAANSHGQMTRSDAFVIDMKAEYAAARR